MPASGFSIDQVVKIGHISVLQRVRQRYYKTSAGDYFICLKQRLPGGNLGLEPLCISLGLIQLPVEA